jgi:hypothetical protein
MISQRSHGPGSEVRQPIQHRHLGESRASLLEVAVHEQQPPAVRQRVVEEAEDRTKGEIAMLEEPALWRQLEGRKPKRIAQKGRVVLEHHLTTGRPRTGLRQLPDDALLARIRAESHL